LLLLLTMLSAVVERVDLHDDKAISSHSSLQPGLQQSKHVQRERRQGPGANSDERTSIIIFLARSREKKE